MSHYKQFSKVEEGDPGVTFKTYDPRKQITVQGEVRVSKELLERDVPGLNTLSFRAGDLEFPHILIRVLEEADYRYDSTYSANDVLTAVPLFLFMGYIVERANIIDRLFHTLSIAAHRVPCSSGSKILDPAIGTDKNSLATLALRLFTLTT